MWFTDATIAFVKEVRANLEKTKKRNAKLEGELRFEESKRNQCYIAIEKLSDESRKCMYICIKSNKNLQKPVLLDEAFRILCKGVNELTEQLELGKKQEELYADLLQRLTQDYYPGILDEIED